MRKYFVIIIFTHSVFISALAQTEKIDSLKKVLPFLHDKERINCLNELSKYYCNYDHTIRYYARTDSAELCAKEAYSEAEVLKYKLGIGEAFLNFGEIYLVRYEFFIAHKYLEDAISLFKELKNEPQLNHAYMSLIYVLIYEGDISSIRNKIEIPLSYYKNIHDSIAEAGVLENLWECDLWEGNHEKAFESLQNYFKLLKNSSDPQRVLVVLYGEEALYRFAGWQDSAAAYSTKIIAYKKKMGLDTVAIGDKGLKYFMEGKWDSAQYYNKQTHNLIMSYKGIDSIVKNRMILRNDIDIASLDQRMGKYNEALPIFMKALQYDKENNVIQQELEVLLNVSQIYKLEEKDNDAIHYLENLLSLAQKTGANSYIQDACEGLWEIYDYRKDSAIAYKYYLKYSALKDSAITGTNLRKLAILNELTNERNQQEQISVLDKDNKLKQDAIQKSVLIRNILLSGLGILILLGFIINRFINLKRKNEKLQKTTLQHSLDIERIQNEKKQSELQNKAAELEMYALRAQMNPHFIFNSLSAINMFILENNRLQASEYLSKFSRLIRLILQNSQESLIPLEKELEALELYLELESLRFENKFEYKIIKGDELDTEMLKVPPLIIQPYVENAIWHGLMHKKETGHLEIELYSEGQILFCKITDDGIGRRKAAELKSKSTLTYKSMGMRITADRIAMLHQQGQTGTFILINDMVPLDGAVGGTEVIIKIPVHYD